VENRTLEQSNSRTIERSNSGMLEPKGGILLHFAASLANGIVMTKK
jgi:hypothetical protein